MRGEEPKMASLTCLVPPARLAGPFSFMWFRLIIQYFSPSFFTWQLNVKRAKREGSKILKD